MNFKACVLGGWFATAMACGGEQPAAPSTASPIAVEVEREKTQPMAAAPDRLQPAPNGSEDLHVAAERQAEPEAKAADTAAAPGSKRAAAVAKSGTKAQPAPNRDFDPAPPATPASVPAVAEMTGPCGDKNQPDCPLQAWMEKHLQAPLDDGDFPGVASGLARAAKLAPVASWNDGPNGWRAMAEAGVEAAKRGEAEATKQACKTCHKAWRSKYKDSYRKRVIAE